MIKMQIKSIQIKCKDTPQFSLQQICSILTQPPNPHSSLYGLNRVLLEYIYFITRQFDKL